MWFLLREWWTCCTSLATTGLQTTSFGHGCFYFFYPWLNCWNKRFHAEQGFQLRRNRSCQHTSCCPCYLVRCGCYLCLAGESFSKWYWTSKSHSWHFKSPTGYFHSTFSTCLLPSWIQFSMGWDSQTSWPGCLSSRILVCTDQHLSSIVWAYSLCLSRVSCAFSDQGFWLEPLCASFCTTGSCVRTDDLESFNLLLPRIRLEASFSRGFLAKLVAWMKQNIKTHWEVTLGVVIHKAATSGRGPPNPRTTGENFCGFGFDWWVLRGLRRYHEVPMPKWLPKTWFHHHRLPHTTEKNQDDLRLLELRWSCELSIYGQDVMNNNFSEPLQELSWEFGNLHSGYTFIYTCCKLLEHFLSTCSNRDLDYILIVCNIFSTVGRWKLQLFQS